MYGLTGQIDKNGPALDLGQIFWSEQANIEKFCFPFNIFTDLTGQAVQMESAYRSSGNSKNDVNMTELDVVTTRIRCRRNRVLSRFSTCEFLRAKRICYCLN